MVGMLLTALAPVLGRELLCSDLDFGLLQNGSVVVLVVGHDSLFQFINVVLIIL
jgi:hypothetical protein